MEEKNIDILRLVNSYDINRPQLQPLQVAPWCSWASIAAYVHAISWPKDLEPGKELEVYVKAPFCCRVGDTFYSECLQGQFLQARLLSVLSFDEYSAMIRVRIIAIMDAKSFVKPVPEEEKNWLKIVRSYNRDILIGGYTNDLRISADNGGITYLISEIELEVFSNSWIYTDADGIDHLFGICDRQPDQCYCYFGGDVVLGYHEDWPFVEREGFLIEKESSTLVSCLMDETEIVIPEGVSILGNYSLGSCRKMERLIIPDSVTDIGEALFRCHNLQEIILTGNPRITVPKLPYYLPQPQVRKIQERKPKEFDWLRHPAIWTKELKRRK